MIRFVEDAARQEELVALCQGSAFGCKLAAIAKAYGFRQSFARFWVGDGAAYCLLDGALSVVGTPGDPDEARKFLEIIGPGAVFSSEDFAQKVALPQAAGGPVLAKRLPPGAAVDLPDPPELRAVYELLWKTGMKVEFEPFYLDLSHRIRHKAAFVLGEYRNGRLIGCGVVSAVSGDAALLSAVAVESKFRRKGIGSALVARVEAVLPGRTLYLMREDSNNREFYAQLGYSPVDRWAQLDR